MRIDVIGRKIDVTDALKTYANQKAGRLAQHFDLVQAITVSLSKKGSTTHGDFEAELVLDVEHHDDFVSHATASDLYAAIDLVVEKGERQLREWKERIKSKH